MQLELLDKSKITARLTPKALLGLQRLDILSCIDSTNTYLLQAAKAGAPTGSVCLAEQQTAGRGRLGRVWYSPFGVNIYCSVLWRFGSNELSGLSVAIAVMIANVLKQYGVKPDIQLKWPNDVWVNQRKLAGILLESYEPGSVVIGIGINLDVQAAGEKGWIDLAEITKQLPDRNFLAGLLVNELLLQLPCYDELGLTPFLADWRRQDILMNKEITLTTPKQTLSGVMGGVNQKGELLLQQQGGGYQAFCYGEVSVTF